MRQLLSFSVLGFVALLVIAWTVVDTVKVNGETFRKMTQGKDLLADVLPPPVYLLEFHDTELMMLSETKSEKIDSLIQKANKSAEDYAKRHALWASSSLPSSILVREAEAYAQGHAFIMLHDSQFVPLIRSGDREGARRAFAISLNPAYDDHRAAIDALVMEVGNYNTLIAADARQQESNGKWMLAGFGLSVIILIVSWSFLLSRRMTEQRSMELRQRGDEERYRFALEAANMGAWEWDIINGEVHWSGAIEPMFGLEKGKFAGTYAAYLGLLHPEDRANVEKAIVRAIDGSTDVYFVEHRVLYPDGSLHWLEGKGRVEKDARGTPVRMRGTVSDITMIKRSEAERNTLEERLQQSQRMESVGRLAGGVAHDFNNLLTCILGNVELARMRTKPEAPLLRYLDDVELAARRSADLTHQLLAFARKQVIQPQLLSLNQCVAEAERLLQRTLGEHIQLNCELSPTPPMIMVDPGQISQVIINMGVNARDAMPGGGSLHIKAGFEALDAAVLKDYPDVRPGRYAMLMIADTGMGIEVAEQKRVFEPFYTTKKPGKGTGLGLATTYGIIKQHGGHIALKSIPGVGSTFSVYLPLCEESSMAKPHECALTPAVAGTPTVLLCEDDALVREVIQAALSDIGYTILVAPDGDKGLQLGLASANPISLLITDFVMPSISGLELERKLREHMPHLKVLFITGYAENAISSLSVNDPKRQLLQKPFSPKELFRKVRAMIEA